MFGLLGLPLRDLDKNLYKVPHEDISPQHTYHKFLLALYMSYTMPNNEYTYRLPAKNPLRSLSKHLNYYMPYKDLYIASTVFHRSRRLKRMIYR